MFEHTGLSKGYGFVRFSSEQEQQAALLTMMNAVGLGGKPLKVGSKPCASNEEITDGAMERRVTERR